MTRTMNTAEDFHYSITTKTASMGSGAGTSHPTDPRPHLVLVREAAPAYGTSLTDDELDELGERCATAYMQADALQYQAMVLLAEFHRRQGWKHTHCSSTDEWLAWRLGIHRHTAQERLRTALALEHLPQTSQAMERGELSYSKVRTLTRAATPENEAVLLDFARAGSAANLDRFIRGWKELSRKDEVTAEQLRHQRRRFTAFPDTDGMVVIRARLDPEVGAVLMEAVDAATDSLYRDECRRKKEEEARAAASTAGTWSGRRGWWPRPSSERRRRPSVGLTPLGCWPRASWPRGSRGHGPPRTSAVARSPRGVGRT